jgi:ankyrin repeat protein
VHKRNLMLLLLVILSMSGYVFWAAPAFAQAPHIVSTLPTQNQLSVPVSTSISVTFDTDMDESTINDSTFVVNARSTGLHPGSIAYDGPSRTATLDPFEDLEEGEVVTVVLTTGIKSSGGVPLDSSYAWSFTLEVYDGSGTFTSHSVYPVGTEPVSVFSADLDGDGDLDLATANFYENDVSILLNNGDGTFAAHSVYPVGTYPRSVFCADLDGDGDLDLAVTNYYSDNVSVLVNNGDGTFTLDSLYPVGGYPASVFSADLDGDGDLDLATANASDHNISVLLNNGDGAFAADSVYPVDAIPMSVFSADLDGDGDLDLASANYGTNTVSVLLNNGDATFAAHSVYTVDTYPYSIFSADLDGDADMDLAVTNEGTASVSVLPNNGDGTFAPDSVYTVGSYPYSVFSADLDGDGDLDLAVANYGTDNVSVLLNNGDGTFTPHSVYPAGASPRSIFSADLDGDGDLDLAVANCGTDNVSVLRNSYLQQVVVTPGYDVSGAPRTDVAVKFYIENRGEVLDVYDVNVVDSLGWNIDPIYYEVTLDPGGVDSVSFTVFIPDVPLGTTNRVFVTAISQADPFVLDSASLKVTCDTYNVQIADVSDVGNDQGKQVEICWLSFPGNDPLVTHFTIFRRADSLVVASANPESDVLSSKDYPPGNWNMVATYPAYGETLYSAVVPTLKDSTIAEGMYWSVFFVRAGTDNPTVYFDSPVDSGYSLDNLSPSPPEGLLAWHEPAVTKLSWNRSEASDFDYYTVYRDTVSGFTPDPTNRLGYTIDSVFVDSTAEVARTCYYLVRATDFSGNVSGSSNEAEAVRYLTGDCNGNGTVEPSDVVYLINYFFRNGQPPTPYEAGDCSCDAVVSPGDVVCLLNYLFRGAPPPSC